MPEEIPAKTAAAGATDELSALLLRAIAGELAQRIIPELKSADAIERATFARLIAHNLAADLDVLPAAATPLIPQLHECIRVALDVAQGRQPDAIVSALTSELMALPAAAAPPRHADVAALRDLAARVLRHLADRDDAGTQAATAALGRCDALWVIDYDTAAQARLSQLPAADGGAAGAPTPEQVTTASVTQYLRRRFPQSPQIAASEVIPIPGGRSKKTFFLSVAGTTQLPRELVIRQDYALKYAGTRVADEYRPLVTLAAQGLPVPRPLHLEAEVSELGPPFILVDRLSGKPPGSYFGLSTPCPGAFRALATMLAKLHRVSPESLGMTSTPAGADSLRNLIAQYRRKWRDNATRSSPVVDFAYAWADRQCARDPGLTSFVHGDAGPYNLLVENDQLKAILDWEFAHVGDPAEDLGVARIYAETCMPWEEFMGLYRAAGGLAVAESRIQLGMLTQFLKGTTLVAASGRNFREGGTTEFIKGANAFTGLRLIELRIAAMLRRFGAV